MKEPCDLHPGLTLEVRDQVAVITIDRPTKQNALTLDMWQQLAIWVKELPGTVAVLILTGAGEAFTSGSDLDEFLTMTPNEVNRAFSEMHGAIQTIERTSVLTIARISGVAFGAGFLLALACDLRIGTPKARFGIPVTRLGIILQPSFLGRLIR
ncbi:enoyl-CoA hydratase/isomerase family protein, partial [Methylacidiphilum caldifontis]|uniref:enoyl-CoA hydratase/isomerase family protein n=1 Tax=Methylacidiphilum caldifontis TaxID=2795386 RepID=UPI00106C5240